MQWGIIMARMGKFAKLQPDEELFILKWLQTASGQGNRVGDPTEHGGKH